MRINTAVFQNNRAHGEDNYFLAQRNRLIGVFDGVSASDGKKASRFVKNHFLKKKIKNKEGILTGLQEAHELLVENEKEKAQTTAAIVYIDENVNVASVGDSPVYLIHKDQIRQVTRLDNDKEEPNVLTQVIGADSIRPRTKTLPIEGRTYLFLATDGISDNISEKEVKELFKGEPCYTTVKARLEKLMKTKKKADEGHVYDEFKEDDQTAVIVRIIPT